MLRKLAPILLLGMAVSLVDAQSTRVRGYVRKDGTYVMPHRRSAPDGRFWNNWSTSGNINPYTGKYGTKNYPSTSYGSGSSYRSLSYSSGSSSYRTPPSSSGYKSPSYSGTSYDLDLELVRIQNEVRLAREKRDAELQKYIDDLRRKAELDEEIRRLTAERDRIQAERMPDFASHNSLPPDSKSTIPVAPAPRKLSHTMYIVNKLYDVEFPEPITYAEALSRQGEVLEAFFPDHFKQYDRHVKASERALNRRDYSGFHRSFNLAKGVIEGKPWTYMKPALTFKRINDARTLILDQKTAIARIGWMIKDAYIRAEASDGARRLSYVYDGDILQVVPGPQKDWLGIKLVSGIVGYVKTSECTVSQYVWVNK